MAVGVGLTLYKNCDGWWDSDIILTEQGIKDVNPNLSGIDYATTLRLCATTKLIHELAKEIIQKKKAKNKRK